MYMVVGIRRDPERGCDKQQEWTVDGEDQVKLIRI
jgi:hypothetical protein